MIPFKFESTNACAKQTSLVFGQISSTAFACLFLKAEDSFAYIFLKVSSAQEESLKLKTKTLTLFANFAPGNARETNSIGSFIFGKLGTVFGPMRISIFPILTGFAAIFREIANQA